ncbi:MAG: phosphatidylglycerophosphatase A [Candidatus Peribacteraceae bacterium]|nr:phosphatidylglycerophosphatase A [Candidatus Peribacteraceae bacterium]
MKFIARLCLSFFGCGYAPIASGTVGSFAAAIGIYFLHPWLWQLPDLTKGAVLFLAAAVIFFGGWFLIPRALQRDFDQSWIVLDEVVGQLVAAAPLFFRTENFLLELTTAFLLFRFFDISKIGSRRIDNLGTPLSVFADDLVAGILAAGALIVIQLLW